MDIPPPESIPAVPAQARRRLWTARGRSLAQKLEARAFTQSAVVRASVAFRERVFDASHTPIVVMDARTCRVLDCNPAAVEIFGLSCREALLGRMPHEFSPPLQPNGLPSPDLARAQVAKALAEGSALFQWQHQRPAGEVWDAEVHLMSFDSDHGELLQLTLRDISEELARVRELKQVTESLRQSEIKFRTLFESSVDGVLLYGEAGFIDCNPAALELYGCTDPGQLRGRTPADISPLLQPSGEPSAALAKKRLAAVMASGLQRFEWVHRRLDTGACFPAEVLLSIMELDGRQVIQAVVQDITLRKRAEQDLLASQEMFFKVFHGAPLLVSLSRLEDGQYIEANDLYCRTMGYSRAEMLGHTSVELGILTLADRTRLIELVGHPGQARNVEFTLHSRTREAVHCLFSGEVVEVGGQNLLIAMLADVTESRLAEQERRRLAVEIEHMQKLESLGCLAGGVAHDMNNVLGAILGLASANLESLAEGSQTYRAFNTIAKAATRGGEMVKSLLAFARQSRVDMTNLDLNGLIRDEVHLLERTTLSRVKLVMDLAEPLAPIRGDSGTLTHAIMNLCVNAVDAMAEGGTLTLRSRNLGPERIEVQVQDTGSGMSAEVLAKAVEPFFTTKEVGKGTGLGLSLVYSTVKAHGGTMELRSEPGQGTCVSMRFPTQAPTREHAQAEALADPVQGSLHILVVDDDELVRSSLEVVLETLGHSTTMFTSGEAALEFLEAGRAADAVILDLNMPGLGGRGTLPLLRALRPDLPVLLATGRADDAAQELAASHPNTWLLSKPFPIEVLRKHLVKWQSL